MTILQALAQRYDRLAEKGEVPVLGFAPAQIAFTIVLDADGRIVGVDDERLADGKQIRPKIVEAPQAPSDRRGERVVAGRFWDPSDYALGVVQPKPKETAAQYDKRKRKAIEKHADFRVRHKELLEGSNDAGCTALLRFLDTWTPDQLFGLSHVSDIPGHNVAFRLEGDTHHIHDRAAARNLLASETAGRAQAAKRGECLVTGAEAPIQRLHLPIKGIGDKLAPLVSFNEEAFTSYGKEKGDNAPVSEQAAFAYATALNALIAGADGTDPKSQRPRYRNRVSFGGDTVVFWAETDEAEQIADAFLTPPTADEQTETTLVRKVMKDMQAGRPLVEAAPNVDPATRVYVLGLSPNAARLSVRFWVDQTLGDLAARFAEHWADLRLDPPPRTRPPPVWALLYELAPQRKAENVPAHLAGELTRAILTGGRYPTSLLAQTVMRIRADQDRTDQAGRTQEKVSALRVAMLKACLARDYRKGLISESVPVSLDPASTNPAYRLGRLFAVLERLQRAALGQRNATIRDRFYAAASATPATVFPSLIRNARNHSKALRSKVGAGLAEWFEDRIAEIAAGLDSVFPAVLPLQEQGRFALGYYHQREAFRRKQADTPAELDDADKAADTDEET